MVLTAHPPHLLQLTEGTVEPSAAGVDHEKDLEHPSLILVFVRVKEHLRRRCWLLLLLLLLLFLLLLLLL